MLLIPIRTDSPVRRTPYVNYALIAVNVVVYLTLDVVGQAGGTEWGPRTKHPLMLWPANLAVLQFLTYQFLHADKWHLIGNMFFLWLFGNSVNSKMGHVTYLLFYLAGGVFAGLGFAVDETSMPCLGASGSIAAVTTAYLVLFPRSEVTIFYWLFFYMGTMQIGSLLWILGKMILWDNYLAMEIHSTGEVVSVAYQAHLAGYLFGFSFTALLLLIRALPRDTYDILAVIRRWYQRSSYAAALRDPTVRAQAQYGRVARRPEEVARPVPVYTPPVDPAERLRQSILESMSNNDFSGAATQYLNMVAADPGQILPRQQQLMVANQLMTLGRYPQAAEAYEKYLTHYPKTADREQVKLILGILYARYLTRYDMARQHLLESLQGLTDPAQRDQAAHWLEVAGSPPSGAQPAM